MDYKLFYASESAAQGIRVMLEELGVHYELIESTTDRSKPRPAKQLEVNPNGWVPVLMYDGTGMYECAAITIFLCDRHSEANLAPKLDDVTRGLYLQTLVYFSSSVQTAFQTTYYPDRFVDMPEAEASAQKRGIKRLRETWQVIDDQIGNNDWVLGKYFSAVDIYLFMLTTWLSPTLGHPDISEFPNVKRVARATMSRPSIQRIYADWLAKNS